MKDMKETMNKLIRDIEDPNSDASIALKQHYQEEAEQLRLSEIRAQEMYVKVSSYESFEEFMLWLSDLRNSEFEKAHQAGKYIEEIPEEWDIVRVAQMYGRELNEDELVGLGNMFLETAHYFNGYVFGVMHGQGSCPWYRKYSVS